MMCISADFIVTITKIFTRWIFIPITDVFAAVTVYFLHVVSVIRAKMSIAHEKELRTSNNGVYPNIRNLPSPLCCFRIMHIRTGTIWIAYCELMWVVSQFSFWTAESVVRDAFPPYIIIIGFIFTFIQLVLTSFLIQGIRKFKLAFIEIYMIGVCCRIFIYISFFIILNFLLFTSGEQENEEYQHFFNRFLILKIIFTAVYTLLKMYALYVSYKCYSYIAKTRRALLHLTIVDEPTSKNLISI